MYCVNCGVKLADTEKQCPLCGVTAFHPDVLRGEGEPLYPPEKHPAPQVGSRMALIILTAVFLLPIFTVLLCETQLSGTIRWSGIVTGALILTYVTLVLPFWFRKPNPVVFVPCSFAGAAVYLLYIDLTVGSGWFLPFALPVTGCLCLIITAVVTLLRYIRRGRLYIFGGAAIALGLFMPLLELLIYSTFRLPRFTGWSLYPLGTLVLLGGTLILQAICRPARETMERKFFL